VKSLTGRSLARFLWVRRSVAVSFLALAASFPPPIFAQTGAIVQAVPQTGAVERLNQNLNRLSRQPTDMEALIGAGEASYQLGDAQAANGFFMRADMVNARNGRVKLGLALVSVALKQPREAAAYFDEAEALGARADTHLFERALTYDLTGQQDKAQADYLLALRTDPGNSALIRAYAVSLGISGKVDVAEAQLRPLLYKSDRGAWRDRTMILAMNGRTAEARRIAQTIMPRSLADSMEPYLVRMGSLTPAQKAAATHYGQFPADGLRLATVTAPPAPPRVETVPAATSTSSSRRRARESSRNRATTVAPASAPVAPSEDSSLLAAMPHADLPPPVQSQPPANSYAGAALASGAAAGAIAGNDDPDGWTAAEQSRVNRRIVPIVPAPVRTTMAQPETPPISTGTQAVRGSGTVPIAPRAAAPVSGPPAIPGAVPIANSSRSVAMGSAASAVPVASPYVPPPSQPANPQPISPAAPVAAPVAAMVQGPPADGAATPASTPTPVPAPVPTPTADAAPQPGFSTAPVAGEAPVKPPRTLAAIMAEIKVSEEERAAPTQAVDLDEVARLQAAKRKAAADKAKKDAAAKAKAEADAKAKAEAKAEAEEKARIKANPERTWVQIATGRDVGALAFDMRRLRKTYSVLAGEDGWTAQWGATRRLLVGPFTPAKAKAVIADLKKAGSDGFVWQSEAGETVAALSGK